VHRVQRSLNELMNLDAPIVQIISLGAGLDTTYWNLRGTDRHFKYIEVDFQAVFERKMDIIAANSELAVEGVRTSDGFSGAQYNFITADLRNTDQYATKIREVCDLTVPTLIIAECVFCYIDAPYVAQIIQIAGEFEHVALISYDMINPQDAFGRMMVENITSRGIRLPGLLSCPTLETQTKRFRQVFSHVEALTMLDIYKTSVDPEERRRIESLEWVDELEEWDLISAHYCIVLGVRGLNLVLR